MTPTPNPHPHDPLTAIRRSTRVWSFAAVVAVATVGAWASWPVTHDPLVIEDVEATTVAGTGAASTPKLALDTAAFSAPLWVPTPPPAPAPVVAQKPAPPPLKLQLVGITRDTPSGGGGGDPILRAALYDPDSDKLLIVAAGEKITTSTAKGSLTYTVAKLTGDAIDLSDGETTRTLSLKDERKPGP